MKTLDIIAIVLVVIGAINWGLVGLFQFDLVAAIFGGSASLLSRLIYTLVGIAGVYVAAAWNGIHRRWMRTGVETPIVPRRAA
jgi:uncharacterized membrane protein YuzA (DUF378 family)